MSARQSTNHLMLMQPVRFLANPETMETNTYQSDNPADIAPLQDAAKSEFLALRDKLVAHGVIVTTTLGQAQCPDDIFCNNWVSTHDGSKMVLYPMLCKNRRLERRPDIMRLLEKTYDVALDLSHYEQQDRPLESTGSLCIDRVNKVVYSSISQRTDQGLAEEWCQRMGYEFVPFNTRNHAGKPVYHTDVMLYIGSGYAGICADAIVDADRARVINKLSETHEIILLSKDQLRSFCGNSLEVRGTDDKKYLALSSAAFSALRNDQKAQLLKYVEGFIHSDIKTIEEYGGGSVRCMLLELY